MAAVVTLLALAAGIGVYWRSTRTAAVPVVTTAAVTRGDVVDTVEATGTLQAVTTVQVGTQVSGTIKALHADFNSQVRRGQVIAELDPALFQTQVEQARASLVRLEADAAAALVQRDDTAQKLRRARELSAQALISTSDLEAAEAAARAAGAAVNSANAQIKQAQASLNQAQVNLDHTVISAPIDGIVISRNVDVGQTVAATMQAPTLFVIANDLAEMQVNASIAESDIGQVAAGQQATFRVDAYPDRTFTGRVSRVRLDPVVQQNVVSYYTTIDVGNADLRLKPGMTATVTVEVARATNVLRVPNSALRVRPTAEVLAALAPAGSGQPATATSGRERPTAEAGGRDADVWVSTDAGLVRVPVRVGISNSTVTAVLAGSLPEGAAVVTSISTDAGTPTSSGSPLIPSFGRGRGAGTAGTTQRQRGT